MQNKQLNNSNEEKKFDKGYLIGLIVTFIINSLIVGLMILYQIGVLNRSFDSECYLILIDAFTIAGGMTCLFYLLMFVSKNGAFDAISYGVKLAFYTAFARKLRETRLPKTYADYRELKRGKDDENVRFVLWVGLLFLLIGVILLIPLYVSM